MQVALTPTKLFWLEHSMLVHATALRNACNITLILDNKQLVCISFRVNYVAKLGAIGLRIFVTKDWTLEHLR